ncbi:MAG: GldG family protein [Gammaproteobacteria bacterium]|nr:MAG: GldG family protein [Gammaproteobacteria bacterium]
MEQKSRSLISAGALVLLAVLLVALTILSSVFLKGIRVDLTENGLYTLSDGTRNILRNMDEPVTLTLYFSEDVSRDLPRFRSYARWAGEMLEEFEDRSGGKLTLQRVDPKPFSPQEDQAAQYGLQGVPVGNAGDVLYFGLVGTNSLDGQQVMRFMQPDKEKFLEYDLAKMVSSLSHPKHKSVGLISGLDMTPGYDPAVPQIPEDWVIYQQLDQLFDLQEIPADTEILPDSPELLILVHPKDFSSDMLYQIDQYVLKGGRLLAFMDPLAEADTGGDRNDPASRLKAGGSSSLGPLLEAWGVGFDTGMVIGDRAYALSVSPGVGQPPVRHLGILSVKTDGMNAADVASADLELVNFSSTGWLAPLDGSTTVFEPLVETSTSAAPFEASRLRFLTNPQDLDRDFLPTGDRYALAARVTGQAASAYKKAPEGFSEDDYRKGSGEAGIQVVLFADTDLLTDRLWVQKQNFLGQTVVNSFADNGTLVVNIADQMLGSQDLIRIRARASTNRPFDRVDALRVSAEAQFRDTEERLQRELDETERTLTEMQSLRRDNELTVLNTEQQDELQRFLDRKLEIRSELRQVQHDLTEDIEALGMWLKFINIVLVPLLIIITALLFGQYRRKRRAGGGG